MTRVFKPLFAIAGTSFLLFTGATVQAQPELENELLLRGTVKTQSGQPLAHATVFLFNLPGTGQVTTDEHGDFTWHVPAAIQREVKGNINPHYSAPECYVLPLEAGWQAVPMQAPSYQSTDWQRTVLQELARRAETKWVATEQYSLLSVMAPDVGRVELKLRNPANQPLANRDVWLTVGGQSSSYAGATVFESKTDANGRLVWEGYSGVRRLTIKAPQVGFGSTGQFQLLPNQLVAAAVPPLAPFGSISGTVAPELLKPGCTIKTDDFYSSEDKWYGPRTPVDSQGVFSFEGMLPGERRLSLENGTQGSGALVNLAPGQQKSGVVLAAPPRPSAAATAATTAYFAARNSPAPKGTVRGHVTDANGAGVGGVNVYLVSNYSNGLRENQEVLSATTAADGSYVIEGIPGKRPSLSLFGVPPQGPPAFGVARRAPDSKLPGPDDAPGAVDLIGDLVLPAAHTSLKIRVLHGGQPAPGVWLRLSSQTNMGVASDAYYFNAPPVRSAQLNAFLNPVLKTDDQGDVVFKDLTPGRWNLAAANVENFGEIGYFDFARSGTVLRVDSNIGSSVDVQAGKDNLFSLNIFPSPSPVAFHVEGPDGQPPKYPALMFFYGAGATPSQSVSNAIVDGSGNGTYGLGRSGLWKIGARFGDTPEPVNSPPFYESGASVAISAALSGAPPVRLHSIRRGLGRFQVQLRGANGKPLTGSVWMQSNSAVGQFAASTTSKGEALFPDMPWGIYALSAWAPGVPEPPSLGTGEAPFPVDSQLKNVRQLLPTTVTITDEKETVTQMQPQLLGYIRGHLKVPDAASNYRVSVASWLPSTAQFRYDGRSGEYIAGPLALKNITLNILRLDRKPGDPDYLEQNFTLDLVPGKVVHADLEPGLGKTTPPRTEVPYPSVTAKILLPDGKTPAWGAISSVFLPEGWRAVSGGRSDALGTLNAVSTWYSDGTPPNPPTGSPTEPVIVVSLPGAYGATIVPLKSAAASTSIVLPPAVAVKGRLTVGGQSLSGLPSDFRVQAAYQGKGKLNDVLSLTATPDADGNFALNGLTPGTYLVQAARDNIWLSATQTLTVGEQDLPDMTFDIAPPGAPIVVHFENAKKEPLAQQRIGIERPSGPLTTALWPSSLMTDARGDLYLNGLEVGEHHLWVQGAEAAGKTPDLLTLNVPAFQPGMAVLTQRLVVGGVK